MILYLYKQGRIMQSVVQRDLLAPPVIWLGAPGRTKMGNYIGFVFRGTENTLEKAVRLEKYG
jgi:hypothetical protein